MKKKFAEIFKGSDNLFALSSVGLTLVFSTFIGFGIGYYADKFLGTKPILMIIFLLLGIAAGFINLFRTAKISEDKNCSSKE